MSTTETEFGWPNSGRDTKNEPKNIVAEKSLKNEDSSTMKSFDSDDLAKQLTSEMKKPVVPTAANQRYEESSSGKLGSSTISSTSIETGAENIRVVVRVRPPNASELHRDTKASLEHPQKSVLWVNVQGTIKPFAFDTIFDEKAVQVEVFDLCGIKDLIGKALDGFSCTAFAFGQTGSGKTHTITGPFDREASIPMQNESVFGLIPRSFEYLFAELQKREESYVIKTSYLEVYNEKMRDLLNPSRAHDSLPVRWSSTNGFYVENVFMTECENVEDMMVVLDEGLQNRQVGTHAMNDHSSRSHTILTVYLQSEATDSDLDLLVSKHGKITFVDLAGSERVKETRPSGEALTESQSINKSLLTLGNCIAALGDPKKRSGHIPYRESKLTKLLADSIGGDGYTLMIACISPSPSAVQDTLNTLRYANRAKNIKNKPVVKMDPKEQMIISLKREVKLLKAENAYFRQQLNVPCSDAQVVMPLTQINGKMNVDENCGNLSSSIGRYTFSSLLSSSESSTNLLPLTPKTPRPRADTAAYALNASIDLYDMLQEYMTENDTLRQQNIQLFKSRKEVEKEHEILSMQNDSLIQKIGNIERVLSSTSLSIHSDDTLPDGERNEGNISPHEILYISKDNQFSFSLPPLRAGAHLNMVANADLAAEVEKEHRKIKDERARIEKEARIERETQKRDSVDTTNNDESQDVNHNSNRFSKNSSGNRDASQKKAKLGKVKLGATKKKVLIERDTILNSYAAKFAARKGVSSKTPENPNKELMSSDRGMEGVVDFVAAAGQSVVTPRNQLEETGNEGRGIADFCSINEQLRKDLEHLDGQIKTEVAFKQRRKQSSSTE